MCLHCAHACLFVLDYVSVCWCLRVYVFLLVGVGWWVGVRVY